MRALIKYYQVGDRYLPEFSSEELVTGSEKQITQYIEKQGYEKKPTYGYDFISNTGAVKVCPVKTVKLGKKAKLK